MFRRSEGIRFRGKGTRGMTQDCAEHCTSEAPLLRMQKICGKPICISDLTITVLGVTQRRPGSVWNRPPHVHEFHECFIVTEGDLFLLVNDAEVPVHANQYFMVPPHVKHTVRTGAAEQPVSCLIVRWQMEKTEPVDPNCIPLADEVIGILGGIYSEAADTTVYDKLFTASQEYEPSQLQCLILAWILGMCNNFSKRAAKSAPPRRTSVQDKNALVHNVNLTLEIMYSRDVDVSQIARDHGISYSRLSRIFKEVTGETIIERLTGIRIEHARELLRDSDLSIREISALTGFNDPYYFSKVYKRAVGVSPGRNRTQMRRQAAAEQN